MKFLLENNDSQEIYDFIDLKTFRWKNSWKTCWYSQLSENDISEETVYNFLSHLKSIDLVCIPFWIDFLDNYRSVEKCIYSETAQILTRRAEENIVFIRPLSNLLNKHNDNFGKWIELFNGDTTLLLKSYLLSFRQDIHFDYSGECLNILMDYDKSLLTKVIDAIYEKEKYPSSYTSMPDLKFLWERTSFYEDIESYAKHVFEKEKNSYGIRDSIFTQLFTKEKGVEDASEIAANKERFLKKSITENINIIDYICFIFKASTYMSEDVLSLAGGALSVPLVTRQDGDLTTSLETYDCIIVATGPPREITKFKNYESSGFWDNDDFEKEHSGLDTEDKVVISGSGDGGVQDFIRILSRQPSVRHVFSEIDFDGSLVKSSIGEKAMQLERASNLSPNPKFLESFKEQLHVECELQVRALLEQTTGLCERIERLCKDRPHETTLVCSSSHFDCRYALNVFTALLLSISLEDACSKNRPINILYNEKIADIAGPNHHFLAVSYTHLTLPTILRV